MKEENEKETITLPITRKDLNFTPVYKVGDIIELDPAEVEMVEDKTDPLFDVRALEAVDKLLAADIESEGFNSVVGAVERSKGKLSLVWGRKRTKAAAEAEATMSAFILDPALSDYELIGHMVKENERRTPDNVMNKARKARKLVDYGLEMFRPVDQPAIVNSEDGVEYNGEGWRANPKQLRVVIDDVARKFGVTPVRIKNQLLKLLELSPKVQKAVENGKLAETVALRWADKSHDKQDEKLEKELAKLKESGGLKIKGKATSKKKDGQVTKLAFKRADLEEIYEAEGVPKQVLDFLGVYLGKVEVAEAPKWLAKMFNVEEAEEE